MIVVERAISLLQPWASLMAAGEKRIETRAWNTNFRGWLAVHASKAFRPSLRVLSYREPFSVALARAGFSSPRELPRGQLIAVVEVVACRAVSAPSVWEIDPFERQLGDYSDGRWAIFTRSARLLRTPIAMNGYLGIWRLLRPITEADLLPPDSSADLSSASCGPGNSPAGLAAGARPKSQ